MPSALPIKARHLIISHRQSGHTLAWISRELGISYGSVQRICARYLAAPEKGLSPSYSNCGKVRRDANDLVFRAVRCFRTWHPSWGAEKIRCELLKQNPSLIIPTARMLQKWFHWNGQVSPRPAFAKTERKWAKRVHQIWQIDAKEHVSIQDGTRLSWLNIVDECSGGIIDAGVFPP